MSAHLCKEYVEMINGKIKENDYVQGVSGKGQKEGRTQKVRLRRKQHFSEYIIISSDSQNHGNVSHTTQNSYFFVGGTKNGIQTVTNELYYK